MHATFTCCKKKNICVCLQAMAIMEVAHGKDHFYLTELRKEMTQK